MRNYLIIIGLLSLTLVSCKQKSIKEKIYGVWVFENEVNNIYKNDTTGFSFRQYPIIYDFKMNGSLVVKNYTFGEKDTILNWFIKSDSILTINNLDYSIFKLNNDSIELIDSNRGDAFWLTYVRPKEVKIDFSKEEIENILFSKIWSIENPNKKEWQTHFEYFDNQTMIYRYKTFDRFLKDSVDNLQIEKWGVAEYKDYFFLYQNPDMSNGNFPLINQLIQINSNSYTTYNYNFYEKFIARNYTDSVSLAQNNLLGNWISHNSIEKNYGYASNYTSKQLKDRNSKLFEGNFALTINKEKLKFQIDSLEPLQYDSWKLSKDSKTLILEIKLDQYGMDGVHVDCVDILELTNEKLKIRLFKNYYFTGLEKPEKYELNLIQEFKKVE